MSQKPRFLSEIAARAVVLTKVQYVNLRDVPRSVAHHLVAACIRERSTRSFFEAMLRSWPYEVFSFGDVDLPLQWSIFETLLTAIHERELGAIRVLDLSAMNYTSVSGVKFLKQLSSLSGSFRSDIHGCSSANQLRVVLNLFVQEQDYNEIEKIICAGPIVSLKTRAVVEVKIAHLKVCLLFPRVMHVLTLMDPNFLIGLDLGYFGDQNGHLLRQIYRQLLRFGSLQVLGIGYLPKSRPLAEDLAFVLSRLPKLQQLSVSAIEMYPQDCANILLAVSSNVLRVLRLHWCDMSWPIFKALNTNPAFGCLRWLELDGVAASPDQPVSAFLCEFIDLLDRNSGSIIRLTIKDVDVDLRELCGAITKLSSLEVLDIASDKREYEELKNNVFPFLGKWSDLVFVPEL